MPEKPNVLVDGPNGDIPEWLKVYLHRSYGLIPHGSLLKIRFDRITHSKATFSMPFIPAVHGNLQGRFHGGAVASLADTAMGAACASLGKRVVTLEMNLNYIRGAGEGETIQATGTVLHNGQHCMIAEAALTDSGGRLLAKARGTFFVIGVFEPNQD